jgi:hypothetical protein
LGATGEPMKYGHATLILCLSFTGCLTSRVLGPKPYTETISAFMISADGKQLAIIGQKYHYLFPAPMQLVATLQSTIRPAVTAKIDTFTVSDTDGVRGSYTLDIGPTASAQIREQAQSLGFHPLGDRLSQGGHLEGRRYSAVGFPMSAAPQTFNHPYEVTLLEDQTTQEKDAKVLLTPLTIAADGVIAVGTLAFVIVTLPIAFVIEGE